MLRGLFGSKKKNSTDSEDSDPTIQSAEIGDILVINGFSYPLEDSYLLIEKITEYQGSSGYWHELVCVENDIRTSIEFSQEDELFITATDQTSPLSIDAIGITEEILTRMDEEHSRSNSFFYEGIEYVYSNSYEACVKGKTYEETGFYIWEFSSVDGQSLLSVIKSSGVPFEVYTPRILDTENISVYKQ
tara:strand:- start:411 stop:977 length:567 start_codon:yes stop_codon:yes gene_type:complete